MSFEIDEEEQLKADGAAYLARSEQEDLLGRIALLEAQVTELSSSNMLLADAVRMGHESVTALTSSVIRLQYEVQWIKVELDKKTNSKKKVPSIVPVTMPSTMSGLEAN